MVEMGMSQQDNVDRGGVEAEVRFVLLVEFALPLKETAVDEDSGAVALHEMARPRDGARRTVERQDHREIPSAQPAKGVPRVSCQSRMLCQIASADSANQNRP